MICNQIVGNAFAEGLSHENEELRGFETVELTWDECAKRILRKKTNRGREIGISLPLQPQTSLRHGDILAREGKGKVLVSLQPCDVFVVFSESTKELGLIAYEFGNRHLPLEVTDSGEIILLVDDPTKVLLNKLHVQYETQCRRFQPIPKGGGHHHHDHDHHHHDHDHHHGHVDQSLMGSKQ
ncbi:urease accessory protein UreE [Bacillus sp. 37MA]|uniref:urease accessory protein UreE n=1 Tax=Bacillus sp. 37MA TaxID=1132442 RepID=UPI00036245C7|nr:urease accessory protein UreE [Bacillus sp. 37MA]